VRVSMGRFVLGFMSRTLIVDVIIPDFRENR